MGITAIEVDEALMRLKRLGLIVKSNKGWERTQSHLASKNRAKTSDALKEFQQKICLASFRSVDSQDLKKRCHMGMAMAINPEKVAIAKKMIDDFMFQLCEVLEDGERKEVYQLQVGLFSLEHH